jgi:hypothetical protein
MVNLQDAGSQINSPSVNYSRDGKWRHGKVEGCETWRGHLTVNPQAKRKMASLEL